jgi:uncharacterized protein YndB with AHSA1/START domain
MTEHEQLDVVDAEEEEEEEEETRRFERKLPHDPEKVWRALTDAKELAAWFPTNVANDFSEAGQDMSFEDKESGDLLEGKVIESDPPHRLTYTMGRERLQFDLTPIPEGCLLVLTVQPQPQQQRQQQQQQQRVASDSPAEPFKCAA